MVGYRRRTISLEMAVRERLAAEKADQANPSSSR
jgi:hypothetical protein